MSFIPEDQEVESHYSTNRTLCKTVATHLECAGFGNEFINRIIINRWRAQEQLLGCFVSCRMSTHYAEAMLLSSKTWLGSYFL